MCLLSQLGLLREVGLIETEGSGENKGRVVLLEETVDYVKEATEVTILIVTANADEGGGYVRRNTDGVLDVQALCHARSESYGERWRRAFNRTYRLGCSLTVVGTTIDRFDRERAVGDIGTSLLEEVLGAQGDQPHNIYQSITPTVRSPWFATSPPKPLTPRLLAAAVAGVAGKL